MLKFLRKLDTLLGPYLADSAQAVFWSFSAVALLICLGYQFAAVPHPYSLDYGEAPLVDQALRLVAGQNLYRAEISTAPYTISNYPPLYVGVVALGLKLFGPAGAFTFGRVISALSAWIAALCVYSIVQKATRDRLAGFVAGVTLLAFPFVTFWSVLLRIDLLALALSLGGLALLSERPVSTRRLLGAALLLTVAIYTRQSYALAAPLAAFGWVWGENRKQAFGLAALVGGLALGLFLILNLATGGGFFYNIVTANVNEFGLERLKDNAETFQRAAWLPILFGGFSLLLLRRWNPLWLLVTPYLLGAVASAATIGKIGSNVNYLLELCAALSLASGAVIAWSRARANSATLQAALLILVALGLGQMSHFMLNEKTGDLRDRNARVNELRRLEALVAATPGPLLADEYMGMLTLQGRPLVIQPFEVTQLARAGQWDQEPLLESLRQNEFAAILIYEPWSGERWTPEMRAVINQSYRLADNIADNKVFLPRTRPTKNLSACPGADWQLPSDGSRGVKWNAGGLDFFGQGQEGKIPVYAVADGWLTRQTDWVDQVVIQHADPLNPGGKIWSSYSGLGAANGTETFIAPDFPPGTENLPVKAGQLLGYQGTWSGKPLWASWVHLHFAVLSAEGATVPEPLDQARVQDPQPYLKLALQSQAENPQQQTLECAQP